MLTFNLIMYAQCCESFKIITNVTEFICALKNVFAKYKYLYVLLSNTNTCCSIPCLFQN